jgi:hypothetical protein
MFFGLEDVFLPDLLLRGDYQMLVQQVLINLSDFNLVWTLLKKILLFFLKLKRKFLYHVYNLLEEI